MPSLTPLISPALNTASYWIINDLRKALPGTFRKIISDDALYIPLFKGIEGNAMKKRVSATLGAAFAPTGTNIANTLNEVGLKLRKNGINSISKLDESLADLALANQKVGKASRAIEGNVRRAASMAKALPVAAGSTAGAAAGAAYEDEQTAAIGAVIGALGGMTVGRGASKLIKGKTKNLVKGLKSLGSQEATAREAIEDIRIASKRYANRAAGKSGFATRADEPVVKFTDKLLKFYQGNVLWSPIK